MTLFDKTPLSNLINVRKYPHHPTNQKESWYKINNSESYCVENSWDRSEEDGDGRAKEPHESKDEPVVVEEIFTIDELIGLAD